MVGRDSRHNRGPAGTALGGTEDGGHHSSLSGLGEGRLKIEDRSEAAVEAEMEAAAAAAAADDGEEAAAAGQEVGSRLQRWERNIEGREGNCAQVQRVAAARIRANRE